MMVWEGKLLFTKSAKYFSPSQRYVEVSALCKHLEKVPVLHEGLGRSLFFLRSRKVPDLHGGLKKVPFLLKV